MSSRKLISFNDKKELSPNGKIDWGYHVAPVLQVRIGTKVRKMVIDPGLFPKSPVRYRTWLAKLKTRKLIYLIMDSDWYLFNSSMIPNSQIQPNPDTSEAAIQPNIMLPDWFSDKLISDFYRYENDCENDYWIEKGLAINETAIAFYNNEIKPLMYSKLQQDLVQDYRNLVGNVFNFETIFRDNRWNYEMNEEFQQKHQQIIAKYHEIYNQNFIHWQRKLTNTKEAILHRKKK